jgi:2-oxo-4-hydroxy-4-carboxy--5-ureidoimidazoline (OHCU) decarboxylase
LYLNLGQDSIVLKKPVSVVVEERKSAGLEYLTNDEFNAIMALNKELRY